MNVWKFAAAGRMERQETENPAPEEGKVRIRVTKLLFNGTDASLFAGTAPCKYPLIPGRYAIGIAADGSEENFLPKGARVLLHAAVPAPDTGTEKKDFAESDDYVLCGRDGDGYMRDIVSVRPSDLTVLPDAVSDGNALLLHHVAIAKAAADKLGVRKGQHVAVVGANVLGILLCQLLISRQAAPILIDTDKTRLDFARANGIYYTLEADDSLVEKVAAMTGGRLAGGAVYVTSVRRNAPSIPFSVCGRGANTVFCGSREDFEIDLAMPFRKSLSVYCVSGRSEHLEASINLMVSGAVDPSPFTFRTIRAQDTEAFLRGYFAPPGHVFREIDVVTLI